MKKVNLLKNEKIIHNIKFSKRIFLIDIIFLVALLTTAARLGKSSIFSFLALFIFFPLLIKSFFDFYRIFFHRVYVTNFRVIYVKGYLLKWIKIYDINKFTAIYTKSHILDKAKNMTSFKIMLDNQKFFKLKNVKEGRKTGEILSKNIKKRNEEINKRGLNNGKLQ